MSEVQHLHGAEGAIEIDQAAFDEQNKAIYGPRFRGAVLPARARLRNPLTVAIYRRQFTYLSRLLYLFTVYERIPLFDQKRIDAAEEAVQARLAGLEKFLEAAHAAVTIALQDNNVTQRAAYVGVPTDVVAPIISPHAHHLLEILGKMDEFLLDLETVKLVRLFEKKEAQNMQLSLKRTFRAFSMTVREQRAKLAKSLKTMADKNEIDAEHTQEATLVVAEEEKGIAEQAHVEATEELRSETLRAAA